MRRVAGGLAALFLALAASPSAAGKPKLLLLPVALEGVPAPGGTSAEWTRSLASRLSDRFDVFPVPGAVEEADDALAMARAARTDYLLESRYTRLGSSSTLSLVLLDPSGKAFETVTSDASLPAGGQGDQSRLTISASARLVQRVFGEGGKPGRPPLFPPRGTLERSSPRSGKIEGWTFARAAKGGDTAWVLASAGILSWYTVRDGETAGPVPVATYPPGRPPAGMVALFRDGEEDVLVAQDNGARSADAYRRARDSFARVEGGGTDALPLRLAGPAEAPVLLAAFPGGGGEDTYGTLRFPGKRKAPVRGEASLADGGRISAAGGEAVIALLPGGVPVRVGLDGRGALVSSSGGDGGVTAPSAGRVSPGKTDLFPVDLDRDGYDEILAVTAKIRPGTFFPHLSSPGGSEVACYSLSAGEPPRLEWRIPLPEAGILGAGTDASGTIHLLSVDRGGEGGGESWRIIRLR